MRRNLRSILRTAKFILPLSGVILCSADTVDASEVRAAFHSAFSGASSTLDRYDGRIIDSISIENRNIFNTDEHPYDNFLFKLANRLNIVTRKHVIGRELLLKPGQRFSDKLALETARNLRTEYSIYDAWFEIDTLTNGHLVLTLVTVDEWSLTGGVKISRSGNETDIELGFDEDNFVGLNQDVTVKYQIQEADENFVEVSFRDRRFFGYPFSLALGFKDDPTDDVRSIEISRPYYNLEQTWSFSGAIRDERRRRDFYSDDNVLIAESFSSGDRARLSAVGRWGTYNSKIGLVGAYDYRFETTTETRMLSDVDESAINFPEDSLYHLFRVGLLAQRIRFDTTSRIDRFVLTEDKTLGVELEGRIGRAFIADFADHVYDKVEVIGSAGLRLAENWLFLDGAANFWYRGGDEKRRTYELNGRFFNNCLPFLTFAVRGTYLADFRDNRSARLELGGSTGLRGYDRRFRVGDRLFVSSFETRWFSPLSLLTVRLGAATFVDLGRTWKSGESLRFNDFYTSLGIGLRLSFERISRGQLIRIDFARNDNDRWHISGGTGQYF